MASSVEVDEGTISYSIRGSGDPLFLIPGFQSSATSWIMYGYPEALPGYRLIMIDPLGHGKSTKSYEPSHYTPERTAAQMLAVLDAEQIDTVPMLGFSRGGQIVGLLRDLFPERVSEALLLGCPLGKALASAQAALAPIKSVLAAGDWDTYWASFPAPLPADVRQRLQDANDPKALAASLDASPEWAAKYPNVGLGASPVPTLSVFGSGENFADELRESLQYHGCDFEEHDWTGHAETLADSSGVAAILKRFLT